MAADKKEVLVVKISAEDKADIEVFASENDLSMSQLVRKAVKEYIKNHKE